MVRLFLVGLCLHCSLCFTARGLSANETVAIDPVWVEKAKSEIPATVERYRTVARELSEETTLKYRREGTPVGGTPFRNRTMIVSIHCLGDDILFRRITTYDDDPEHPEISLDGRNKDYSFKLTQRQPDAPYILIGYNRDTPSNDVKMEGGFYSTAYMGLRTRVLAAINAEQGHKLLAMRWDPAKNLLFAATEVVTTQQGKSTANKWEHWIDPNRRWHIIEQKFTGPGPSRSLHTSVTYGDDLEGEPCPVKIEERSIQSSSLSFRIEIDLNLKKTTKSPADFRLSAFGLPEPVDVPQQQQNPRYLWFLLGAALFAALAFFLRYFARRRRQSVNEAGA